MLLWAAEPERGWVWCLVVSCDGVIKYQYISLTSCIIDCHDRSVIYALITLTHKYQDREEGGHKLSTLSCQRFQVGSFCLSLHTCWLLETPSWWFQQIYISASFKRKPLILLTCSSGNRETHRHAICCWRDKDFSLVFSVVLQMMGRVSDFISLRKIGYHRQKFFFLKVFNTKFVSLSYN